MRVQVEYFAFFELFVVILLLDIATALPNVTALKCMGANIRLNADSIIGCQS